MNTRVWKRIFLLVAACAPTFFISGAFAQSSMSGKLDEIVVTAERRTQNLQDVAISASVLTGDMLADRGVTDLYRIQYAVPSVTIADFGSANEFNIRGIGRTQVDIDVPSGVVIYRDGAPTIAGYFQGEPYYDIKSVEVLRGPQGTFVGKSAAGGAVFVNSNDPDFDGVHGSLQAGGGNIGEKEVQGVLNYPISDTVAARIAYNHLDSGNFYHLTGNYTGHPADRDLNSIRGVLLWKPNEQFTAKVKVDYNNLNFGGNVTSAPGYPLYNVEQNGDMKYWDKAVRVVGNLSYLMDNGIKVTSVTAFQDLNSINNLDLNASLPEFYQFKSRANVNITSEEVNIISPENERFRWVAGAMYYVQRATLPRWPPSDGFTFYGGSPFGFHNAETYPWITSPWFKYEDEWSMFGHIAYDLTDKITVEGGLRYSDYYTDQVTNWVFGFGNTPPSISYAALFGFPTGDIKQKLSEDSLDGQASINYKWNDDNFLYALFSRGHIQGGINIFPPFRSYQEEQVFNYEGGWKANWMEDQVRTQLTLYYQAFDHYQVNFEQPLILGGQDNRNAPGDSSIWGVEFSLQSQFDNLHVDYSFAYMDSDIGKFTGVHDPYDPNPASLTDISHERTPYSPHVTTSGGIAYDFALGGSGYTFTPRIDVSYVSSTQSKLWQTPLVELKARTLANIQAVLSAPDDKWSATFWMTNVFDKHYVAGIQNLSTLYYAGRLREFGVRVKYNF